MNLEELESQRASLMVGQLLRLEKPEGLVPHRELFELGLPVVGDGKVGEACAANEVMLRASAVGRWDYPADAVVKLMADQGPAATLGMIWSHLEMDGDCPQAWADAAVCAVKLQQAQSALDFAQTALKLDPTQGTARKIVESITGKSIKDAVVARERLEIWVRRQAPRVLGPVLDVGTSRSQRAWIDKQAVRYTLDLCSAIYDPTQEMPDIQADLEDLRGVETGRFGTVICTEVLEHVRRPDRALRELLRVTRPGGTLLLSVPWFYPFHPCPLDLRRFTAQGLQLALEEAGWVDVEVGGLRMPEQAHQHIVEALTLMTGKVPANVDSMAFSNWTVVARRSS